MFAILSRFLPHEGAKPKRTHARQDVPLKPNDVVQLEPGYDPGRNLGPLVVQSVTLGQVTAAQYGGFEREVIVVPSYAVARVGRLAWKLDGTVND